MNLASLPFLYAFLPLALAAAAAAPARRRNAVLLAASLFFVAWGEPRFVFALLASCLVDHRLAVAAARSRGAGRLRRARAWCAAGVSADLLLLGVFKYADFALGSARSLLGAFGVRADVPVLGLALPLGISFFTFQKISYLVDVARGETPPAPSFGRYLLHVLFFPRFALGPIVRYRDLAPQLDGHRATAEEFLSGLWRVALGLARKTLLAAPLGTVADAAFGAAGGRPGPAAAWAGLLAYSLQIYNDFAGYCDMAVGAARMLGVRLPENFDAPYVSRDVAEFWRRWHATLGAFMKEYLYIPLGGNRRSRARTLLNNWTVFLVSGLWHGAAWNFVVWGAWHGFWICAAKSRRRRRGGAPLPTGLRAVPAAAATFLVVSLGWVFFRAPGLGAAGDYLADLAGLGGGAGGAALRALAEPGAAAAAAVTAAMAALPLALPRAGLLEWRLPPDAAAGRVWLRTAATGLLLALATLPLLQSGFRPFIYNRF